MAPQALNRTDERLNELSDRDAFWGPLLGFRPDKNRCFSGRRVFALAAAFGGFYGMLLNLALGSLCKICGQESPSVYAVPVVLTFTYWVGLKFTLIPAWNRRARLLVRRADYLHSIGRQSEPLL